MQPRDASSRRNDGAVPAIGICVVGMHRSGTSALTRVLSLAGAALPPKVLGPCDSNVTGHWEPKQMVLLHKQLLGELHRGWDEWTAIDPAWFASPRAEFYAGEIAGYLRTTFGKERLFVIKEPRLCRLVPLWTRAFELAEMDVRMVQCIRNPLEVIDSLHRRNGTPAAQAVLVWLRHVLAGEKDTRGIRRVWVSYQELLDDWASCVRTVQRGLDVPFRKLDARVSQQVDAFLDRRHCHHDCDPDGLTLRGDLPYWVKETYQVVRGFCDGGESEYGLAHLDAIRSDFDRATAAADELIASVCEGINVSARDASSADQLAAELERTLAGHFSRIAELEQTTAIQAAAVTARDHTLDQQTKVITALRAERATLRRRNAAQLEAYQAQRSNARELAVRLDRAQATSQRKARQILRLDDALAGALDRAVELAQPWLALGSRLRSWPGHLAAKGRKLAVRRRTILRSGLFDPSWYGATYPTVGLRGLDPVIHYLTEGEASGCKPNPLFDPAWYLARHADIGEAGLSPLMHYVTHGGPEVRWPNCAFAACWYAEAHPAAKRATGGPLAHYLTEGIAAGLAPHPLFDVDGYDKANPAARGVTGGPLAHYLDQGMAAGRSPSAAFDREKELLLRHSGLFDAQWYRRRHPEVDAAGLEPLAHYMFADCSESPSPWFDAPFYLHTYPEVGPSGIAPLLHYLLRGSRRGYQPNIAFDPAWYRRSYPHVADSGLDPLAHYVEIGWREGCRPHPLFDGDGYLQRYAEATEAAAAGISPMEHYLTIGLDQGRPICPELDLIVRRYAEQHD